MPVCRKIAVINKIAGGVKKIQGMVNDDGGLILVYNSSRILIHHNKGLKSYNHDTEKNCRIP
jgi:hypothetical protein